MAPSISIFDFRNVEITKNDTDITKDSHNGFKANKPLVPEEQISNLNKVSEAISTTLVVQTQANILTLKVGTDLSMESILALTVH